MTYGIDLVDFIAGRIVGKTPRLLVSLIEKLPEGSEYMAEMAGGREFRDWNTTEYLLAAVVNAVHTNTLATANWSKGKRPEIPFIEGPQRPDGASAKASAGDKPMPTLLEIMARFAPPA